MVPDFSGEDEIKEFTGKCLYSAVMGWWFFIFELRQCFLTRDRVLISTAGDAGYE